MGYTSLYDIDYTICDKWTNDRILSHLFFWWNEFIRLVVDKLWYKKKMSVVNEAGHLTDFSTSLFLMGIYWVFIVVFLVLWQVPKCRDYEGQYDGVVFS